MADRGTLQVRHVDRVFTGKTKFMDKSLLQGHLPKPRVFEERCGSETLDLGRWVLLDNVSVHVGQKPGSYQY